MCTRTVWVMALRHQCEGHRAQRNEFLLLVFRINNIIVLKVNNERRFAKFNEATTDGMRQQPDGLLSIALRRSYGVLTVLLC